MNQKSVTLKHLANMAGQLSTMHLGLCPIVIARNIYHDVDSRFSWHKTKSITSITKETKKKLKFWLKNIISYRVRYTYDVQENCLSFKTPLPFSSYIQTFSTPLTLKHVATMAEQLSAMHLALGFIALNDDIESRFS